MLDNPDPNEHEPADAFEEAHDILSALGLGDLFTAAQLKQHLASNVARLRALSALTVKGTGAAVLQADTVADAQAALGLRLGQDVEKHHPTLAKLTGAGAAGIRVLTADSADAILDVLGIKPTLSDLRRKIERLEKRLAEKP